MRDRNRAGRWPVAQLLGAAAGFVLGLAVLGCQGAPRQSSLEEATTPAVEEAAPFVFTTADTIRRGDTFTNLLLRNRLSMQEIVRILELNQRLQLFSPRGLRPGQTVELTHDDFGRLSRLSIQLSVEETYIFETQGDSLIAYLVPVDREARLRKFQGTVDSSFDEAIHAAGGDHRLTLKVADVLAYDVDFFTEVRRGDQFSLLVEERFADGQFLGYGEILYGRYEGERARSTAIWFRNPDTAAGGYYDSEGKALRKAFLRSPLNYRRISSHFSNRRFHPVLRTYRPHHGIDYAADVGTPVVAVADGLVESAGWSGGYGRLVKLRHARGMETRYGHLSKYARGIRRGVRVRQGEVVGYVGKSGLATGPHLHYEVLENGHQLNPLKLRNVPADPIPSAYAERFRQTAVRLEELESVLLAGQVLEWFDLAQLPAALAQLETESGSDALR